MNKKVRKVWIAFFLVALHIGMAMVLSEKSTVREAYVSLVNWDGGHYAEIAKNGYRNFNHADPSDANQKNPTNAAFFPGYPYLARLIYLVFHLDPSICLLIISQLSAFGLWTYFLSFLERIKLKSLNRALAVFGVFSYPVAFYFVSGYSEALFTLNLLGFLYWVTHPDFSRSKKFGFLAGLHGFGLSFTRIAGLPLAIAPLVYVGLVKIVAGLKPYGQETFPFSRGGGGGIRSLLGAGFLSGVAVLGGLSFFTYCQIRFGHWDQYMLMQRNGWGVQADYFFLFHKKFYVDLFSIGGRWMIIPLTVVSVLLGIEAYLVSKRRLSSNIHFRGLLYFAILGLLYLNFAGLLHAGMSSIIRHLLPIHVLWVLAAASLSNELKLTRRQSRAIQLFLAFLFCYTLFIDQTSLCWHYLRGDWVS